MTTHLAVLLAAVAAVAPGSTGSPGSLQEAEALRKIEIPVGDMVFDALAAGPEDGPLVLLLHGFPQTSLSYKHQLEVLGRAGFHAVAPDQRGYSPRARPADYREYAIPLLVGDVLGMADALGVDRFHLVGHDWGGAVAWVLAGAVPQRVLTLTALSTPHVAAMARFRADPSSEQAQRSSYFAQFSQPGAEVGFLENDAALLMSIWSGLDPDAIAAYREALGNPETLAAALAWYRAAFGQPATAAPPAPPPPSPSITLPTLYVWGTEDPAFAREAAEATRDFVEGPYRFVELEGEGHWVAERSAERVSRLILEHVTAGSPPDPS